MKNVIYGMIVMGMLVGVGGCGDKDKKDDGKKDAAAKDGKKGGDHVHNETPLGKHKIGEWEVEAMIEIADVHGDVAAGKESHLVIKLPKGVSEKGQTIVRTWIGTEDRTKSTVSKGTYAAGHDDYDIHVTAPSPLPEGSRFWVEIETSDGKKAVGSVPTLKEFKASGKG